MQRQWFSVAVLCLFVGGVSPLAGPAGARERLSIQGRMIIDQLRLEQSSILLHYQKSHIRIGTNEPITFSIPPVKVKAGPIKLATYRVDSIVSDAVYARWYDGGGIAVVIRFKENGPHLRTSSLFPDIEGRGMRAELRIPVFSTENGRQLALGPAEVTFNASWVPRGPLPDFVVRDAPLNNAFRSEMVKHLNNNSKAWAKDMNDAIDKLTRNRPWNARVTSAGIDLTILRPEPPEVLFKPGTVFPTRNPDLSGRWHSNLGPVEFKQDGDKVLGTLRFDNGVVGYIDGTVGVDSTTLRAQVLRFSWGFMERSLRPLRRRGHGELVSWDGGKTWSGRFTDEANGTSGTLTLRRPRLPVVRRPEVR